MKVVVFTCGALLFTALYSCQNDGEDTANSLEQSKGNYPANDSDQGGGGQTDQSEMEDLEGGAMPPAEDVQSDSMGANRP